MKVQDPSGQVWRVSRRWLPWRRKAWDANAVDLDPTSGDISGVDDLGCLVVLVLVVAVALLAPAILLGLLVAAEFLLLLLLLPVAVLVRALFGKAWHVEVRRGWKAWHEQEAGDWQASTLRIHDLARAIEAGEVPPRTLTGVQWRRQKASA